MPLPRIRNSKFTHERGVESEYDGNMFTVKIRKRAHTPILKSVDKLKDPFAVPWLDGKKIQIKWTA